VVVTPHGAMRDKAHDGNLTGGYAQQELDWPDEIRLVYSRKSEQE
jgi:hypothetical protein